MLQVAQIHQYRSDVILTLEQAAEIIKGAKNIGKTIGLCHGGFDLLHPGHVKHFESGKSICDMLVVSVTSDKYVSGRKGQSRPVFTDTLRAYMVASLRTVDFVVISDFKRATEIITTLKPTYYIKGPDFIGKKTPGIQEERSAIESVGGQMRYTDDPPSSTTAVIEYIQNNLKKINFLLVVDRDGTLIVNDDYLGRNTLWQNEFILNDSVVNFLSFVNTKYQPIMIVVSNQSGVARGYFSEGRVQDINAEISRQLTKQGNSMSLLWEYCPDVDEAYAKVHPEVSWDQSYIKQETRRKPSPKMVIDAISRINMSVFDFEKILVLGNSRDDQGLANFLSCGYIDVTEKSSELLIREFNQLQG